MYMYFDDTKQYRYAKFYLFDDYFPISKKLGWDSRWGKA